MLPVDLVAVDAELAWVFGFHVEQVAQAGLDTDDRLVGDGCFQDTVEIVLGGRKEILHKKSNVPGATIQ